ncbi:dynamin family protein [Ruminococcus flavefaciens]|uniref:dynamin family protein n=1 Tax=Ruminococcus flavefaciens TaxID=1265 RepID=UPI0026EF70BB|nr:dynamin family protein [Ruminococcus flavefaciens]
MKETLTVLLDTAEYLKDSDSIAQIKRLQNTLDNQHYLLTVAGQFSAGKSRLINNLLEREVLPVHITETTAIVTFLKYGEEEQVQVLYRDGTYDTISIEESLRLWQGGESEKALSKIMSINITLCSELLKNGLVIADTPGVNTIIESHIEETESILSSADRVLYVMKKPMTNSDSSFIHAIETQGVPVILVRTHMDDLKLREENALDTIAGEKEQLMEFSQEKAFFISNEKSSDFYVNLKELRNYLMTEIASRVKEAVKVAVQERILFIAKRLNHLLQDRRIQLNTLLSTDNDVYQEKHNEIEAELQALETTLNVQRKNLAKRYEEAQKEAVKNLTYDKESEIKKVQNIINGMDTKSMESCQAMILSNLRKSFERLHGNYCDTFNKLIAENNSQFMEELRQKLQMTDIILELPNSLEAADEHSTMLTDKMQALFMLKNQLSEEIDKLEQVQSDNTDAYASAEKDLIEMRHALDEVQAQLDDYPQYVARYITNKGSHAHEKVWRGVGNVLDWATILIPGPAWAKAGEKILKVGAKGAKAVKAVKAADAFIDGARILGKVAKGADTATAAKSAKILKNADKALDAAKAAGKIKKTTVLKRSPVLYEFIKEQSNDEVQPDTSPVLHEEKETSLLDYIGLDYWFAKIGKNFDTPDTKYVDIEYENEYFKQKNAIVNELRRQANEEFEKKIKLQDIKDEQERLRIEKDIMKKKMETADKQIAEMKLELEAQKKQAYQEAVRKYYADEADKKITQYAQHILDEIRPEIEQKMRDYINLYDFRISGDIAHKRSELEKLETEFHSAGRQQTEQDLEKCQKFADLVCDIIKVD